jgi:aryl carrier-like protein
MPPEPYIDVKRLKSFAKLVKQRFALSHSMALLSVCRASGYRDLGELYDLFDSGSVLDSVQMSDYAAWLRRLGSELGSDLQALMKREELYMWFRRIHAIRIPEGMDDSYESDD